MSILAKRECLFPQSKPRVTVYSILSGESFLLLSFSTASIHSLCLLIEPRIALSIHAWSILIVFSSVMLSSVNTISDSPGLRNRSNI